MASASSAVPATNIASSPMSFTSRVAALVAVPRRACLEGAEQRVHLPGLERLPERGEARRDRRSRPRRRSCSPRSARPTACSADRWPRSGGGAAARRRARPPRGSRARTRPTCRRPRRCRRRRRAAVLRATPRTCATSASAIIASAARLHPGDLERLLLAEHRQHAGVAARRWRRRPRRTRGSRVRSSRSVCHNRAANSAFETGARRGLLDRQRRRAAEDRDAGRARRGSSPPPVPGGSRRVRRRRRARVRGAAASRRRRARRDRTTPRRRDRRTSASRPLRHARTAPRRARRWWTTRDRAPAPAASCRSRSSPTATRRGRRASARAYDTVPPAIGASCTASGSPRHAVGRLGAAGPPRPFGVSFDQQPAHGHQERRRRRRASRPRPRYPARPRLRTAWRSRDREPPPHRGRSRRRSPSPPAPRTRPRRVRVPGPRAAPRPGPPGRAP